MRVWPRVTVSLVAVIGGLVLMLVGTPEPEDRLARMGPALDAELATREYHLDPAEVLDLMYDDGQQIFLIDVRAEADYNQFHLLDVRWRPLDRLTFACCRQLPTGAVKVVMSNDEVAAQEAWRRMRAAGLLNAYVLAGGINLWLDIYGDGAPGAAAAPPHDLITGEGDDTLRHRFTRALGGRHPASLPGHELVGERRFERKVKIARPTAAVGGGCG